MGLPAQVFYWNNDLFKGEMDIGLLKLVEYLRGNDRSISVISMLSDVMHSY